jgi:hypothetical protein
LTYRRKNQDLYKNEDKAAHRYNPEKPLRAGRYQSVGSNSAKTI